MVALRRAGVRKRWAVLGPLAALAFAGACGGDADGGKEVPRDPTTTSTTATGAPLAVDWRARTVTPSSVGPWEVRFCEGDGPLICLHRDGTLRGALEVNTFPLDSFDDPSLDAIAEDTVRTFQADRKDGCGADYVVRADPKRSYPVLGTDGRRYGWSVPKDGAIVERNLTYARRQGRHPRPPRRRRDRRRRLPGAPVRVHPRGPGRRRTGPGPARVR